jgi:hypothetical protein
MNYVPRHDRPARMAALAAFQHFLAKHPDLRIGQALLSVMESVDLDLWEVEDEEILEHINHWDKNNP